MGRIACILVLLVVSTGFGQATYTSTYTNTYTDSYTNAVSDNAWKIESSVFECRLVHPFPFFGEAVFSTRAGENSAFYLNARSARFQEGEALVSTRTPIWKPERLTEELGFIAVKQGKRAVGLDSQWTEKIMARLYAGREVEISSPLWFEESEERKPLTLVMSAVGFRPAYKQYLGCLTSLLPSNFEQMQRTALYFPSSAADEIPPPEADKLDRILKIVKHDRSVRSFFVDGHTDSIGDRAANLEVSKDRAQLVAQYLMRRGVPGDWITVRWHGERYPVASNNTENGRARNRRVTLRLERVEEIEVLPLAYK